jgi:hypothetical protein
MSTWKKIERFLYNLDAKVSVLTSFKLFVMWPSILGVAIRKKMEK